MVFRAGVSWWATGGACRHGRPPAARSTRRCFTKMPRTTSATAAATTVRAPARWVLLIYTVPAEPSRKRAYVWRELKKVGAVYLRDGVGVLPQRDATVRAFTDLATKVHEFDGRATLIQHA